jgi:hypothetical protein
MPEFTQIREPVEAGRFYPADAATLREDVRGMIRDSGVDAAPERVSAIISPHAGYLYSGATAGAAFARVAGGAYRTVVVLGCSHRQRFASASVFAGEACRTPLGAMPIDRELAQRISGQLKGIGPEPHLPEHALEVLFPFVQVALGDEIAIVPVLFGGQAERWHVEAGRQLAQLLGDDVLLVVSTDLSHYLTEDEARAVDNRSLQLLLGQDPQTFVDGIGVGQAGMCGASAVAAAMSFALEKGACDWRLLDYRTSAAASGDRSHVVGYAAVSMEHAA